MFKNLVEVEAEATRQSGAAPNQHEAEHHEQWHGTPAQIEELPKGIIEDEI
jgi:hypothetical protein